MREIILERLEKDLVGPYSENEVLYSRPSDVYLTGILWPRQTRMAAEDDERLGLSGAGDDEISGGGEEEAISLAGLKRPSSAGISFAAASDSDIPGINVSIRFATYEPVEVAAGSNGKTAATQSKITGDRLKWSRQPYKIEINELRLIPEPQTIELEKSGAPADIKLHVRTANWSNGKLATVTLLNYTTPEKEEGRKGVERTTLFQVQLGIRPVKGTYLIARPSRRAVIDEDDRSSALLYRDVEEFAVGHTCSARWEQGVGQHQAELVATAWIPKTIVPSTSARGHKIFNRLRTDTELSPLSANWLAEASDAQLREAMLQLPGIYEEWIQEQESRITDLPVDFQGRAKDHIDVCREVQTRMADGARKIADDDAMRLAFRLANRAMSKQYSWSQGKGRKASLEWRPFQLAFILLTASSAADRNHPDRQIMDLLWFPTGGGKTEAYLGLIAFLAFYRRLSNKGNPGMQGGVVAIMRYTLRLLTTQQFTRAAAVILACEVIRRGLLPGTDQIEGLGGTPFSIGLWVGGEAVPNKVKEAASALAGAPDQPTPKQLVNCPACGERLYWFYNEPKNSINVQCQNKGCCLNSPKDPLPVWTVDEDLYRKKPTLLIGTIDKFAQIVRRKQVNSLFGLDISNPPDIIIQDELHLISGPLGTVAGLYEAAIDRMFAAQGGKPPKIIGSTATIRRASDQVTNLFLRKTAQFPPPCLDALDSGFAVTDPEAPGRVYAGVTTAGRSAKFTLQAVAASLLQAASAGTTDDTKRDPYWTLISYFNSLRELGGALVLMQDDVNDSLSILAERRDEPPRRPGLTEELTSRRTQAEVRDMLTRMEIKAGRQGALDVVLATNMLSVGVDIPRLGLMLVNGQPKGIAEYIQATSRVGRGKIPGLVISILNNAKARDRSHYEAFSTWHQALYRDVEPTSVTPFASRARDRALHAVLVALIRHLVPGMLEKPVLDTSALKEARNLITDIVQRAESIDQDETAVRSELERLVEIWNLREPKEYWSRRIKSSLLQDAERAATLRAMGRLPGDAWPTLNNMRSVEASVRFRLAEGLRARVPREAENGK